MNMYRFAVAARAGLDPCAASLAVITALLAIATPAFAQDGAAPPSANGQGRSSMLDEIVVTATKQSRAQVNQKVPITISAFNSKQIDDQKLTTIQNLAYSIPNVSFDSPGGTKGTATFAIRGLGLNSSVASTAPTVGVFVNGMYLGVNQGVLLDTFDLEGIEVLRGPQGTLFGRNVTGGAVLLNNAKPQQTPDLKLRGRIESGPLISLAGAGGGGLTDTISARLAVLYDHDAGYWNNVTLHDSHFGKDKEYVIRPSLRYQHAGTDITLFGEYGKETGDGPMTTAPDYTGGTTTTKGTLPPIGLDSNRLYENFRGTTNQHWENIILNGTQDVGFGRNGQIANILGYRHINAYSEYASDGTPLPVSQNASFTRQTQISEELRYNGSFGPLTVTVGGYYYWQKMLQLNKQFTINATQGGRTSETVFAAFGEADYKLLANLTLQLGGRYTYEKKKADISPLASENSAVVQAGTFGTPGTCNLVARTCNFEYTGLHKNFKNFSPKVALQYQLAPTVQFYASWQKAFRSGGYNVRYNAPDVPPPYNPEKQDAFEVGFKSDLFDRKTRINGALFLTKIKSLQRDVTIFDSVTLANRTTTANTANATTKGFELEYIQQIVPHLVFNGNVGYVHARYTKILYDITQDGVVNAKDYAQKLPRATPWTWNMGLTADHEFGLGKVTVQGNYSHRDASYFPDYNTDRTDMAVPMMPAVDLFDLQASLDLAHTGLSFTIYGKNLTNVYSLSSFTPIVYPTLKGCSCLPNKGRIIGFEVNYKM